MKVTRPTIKEAIFKTVEDAVIRREGKRVESAFVWRVAEDVCETLEELGVIGGKHLITEEGFTKLTGRAPENDDLDRVNCKEAGKPGHYSCGVCPTCGKPAWDCEHFPETTTARMERERG